MSNLPRAARCATLFLEGVGALVRKPGNQSSWARGLLFKSFFKNFPRNLEFLPGFHCGS
eukprot:SAG25_NODE_22_length_22323_cov_52.926874_17_plen_59_part_00